MMERYNSDARCPKCGHDDIGTTYVKWSDSLRGGCYEHRCGRVNGEHLHRNCRRCGYRFAQHVLGAGNAPSPTPADPNPHAVTPPA